MKLDENSHKHAYEVEAADLKYAPAPLLIGSLLRQRGRSNWRRSRNEGVFKAKNRRPEQLHRRELPALTC